MRIQCCALAVSVAALAGSLVLWLDRAVASQPLPWNARGTAAPREADRVRPLSGRRSEREPPVTANAVFIAELPNYEWANPEADWIAPVKPAPFENREPQVIRHRSPFPGDVFFQVEPYPLRADGYVISLCVASSDAKAMDGYRFTFSMEAVRGNESPAGRVALFRAGLEVASRVYFNEPETMVLRRHGRYVVGEINGEALLSFRDDAPLAGTQVSFSADGAEIPPAARNVSSSRVRETFFSQAPVAWRTAGVAVAEVANRWQSEPRYSFFSLRSERNRPDKAAVLWNKHLYPGDLTVSFFAATRMEGERGQPYTYTRDINVTICSDGKSLSSGYTFMFGGFGNRYSAILRNGVEVARHEKGIPTDMNYHRHWFNVRVQKIGNKVSFRVDRIFKDGQNAPELVYEDPEPLMGKHFAIWTYNNAIMLSRVRIAGESEPAPEHPDTPSVLNDNVLGEPLRILLTQ